MTRVIYHLARADFLERTRRYSYLVVLGASVLVGYSLVPAMGEPYNAFVIHDYRGIYNSAWVGTVFGVMVSTLLTLLGFYLVRDAVKRDYRTRVGEIIATTPVSKPVYMLGKWLSNLAVLTSILIVLTVMAAVMQLVRAEDPRLDLIALVTPIWMMGLPALAVVSAITLLFELIPILRSGVGGVVYLLLLMWLIAAIFISPGDVVPRNDFAGVSRTIVDLREHLGSIGLDTTGGTTDLFVPTEGREVVRFEWDGLEWDRRAFFERLIWFAIAVGIAGVASIPFDRFDPARRRLRDWRKRRAKGKLVPAEAVPEAGDLVDTAHRYVSTAPVPLTPIGDRQVYRRFWATVLSEFRLIVRGQAWWWYVVVLGLFVANLVSPFEVCRQWLAPAAWLWPIFVWSGMGALETRHQTRQMVYSIARLTPRQLPALWVAGVVTAVIVTSGIGIRLALLGEWPHLGGWFTGALFVPSLALALGTWTNSSRLFEIVYVIIWYLGVFRVVTALDFASLSDASVSAGNPLNYIGMTFLLLVVTWVGRRRQIVRGR